MVDILKLQDLLENSVSDLLSHKSEVDNLRNNVNERTTCGRLALYIDRRMQKESIFENYYADQEYNRMQDGRVKMTLHGKEHKIVINPDIAIHSRGFYDLRDRKKKCLTDNLLVVEAKKSTAPISEIESDKIKLIAMTKAPGAGVWSEDGRLHPEYVCGYKLGCQMIIDLELDSIRLDYYTKGVMRKFTCITIPG